MAARMEGASSNTGSEVDQAAERRNTMTSATDVDDSNNEGKDELRKQKTDTSTVRTVGRLRLRGKTDNLPQDWWFAGTAVPLIAATIGPMANVFSIAAIVTEWRQTLPDNGQLPNGTDDAGVGYADPKWEIAINAASLVCGFIGNFYLLLNFTRRVRYIIALPMTIIFWYFATGMLIGAIAALHRYAPPIRPGQTYSQGFWYAIQACVLYLVGSMLLMLNMLGYILGHYPQQFELDDSQRTLILQTMLFFIWLAGGAAVFANICNWSFPDALYFCEVTVLTVGFGDFVADNDVARGLVFPYSVGGIIFLGLMIQSIAKFAKTLNQTNIIKKHEMRQREKTYGRSVTDEQELRARLGLPPRRPSAPEIGNGMLNQNGDVKGRYELNGHGHISVDGQKVTFHGPAKEASGASALENQRPRSRHEEREKRRLEKEIKVLAVRRKRLLLLKEEKDRFEAMRRIQHNTRRFKKWYSLSLSILAFSTLWCIGALVFMYAEARLQNLSYFEALYFCYVCLLTIGYGDFSPRSNAGKAFFVIWSLVAVPTMTILVSDLSDTVVSAIERGTWWVGDWTVLPKQGVWRDFLEKNPRLRDWIVRWGTERKERKRVERGFQVADPDDVAEEQEVEDTLGTESNPMTLERLADQEEEEEHQLARHLAVAIKRVAQDIGKHPPKQYSYEEWVEFTRLIRFSAKGREEVEREEEEEGLVEWDWIGEDSPMLADVGESQWVLDRLYESLNRYIRRQARKAQQQRDHNHKRHRSSRRTSRHDWHDERLAEKAVSEYSLAVSRSDIAHGGSSSGADTSRPRTDHRP